MKKSWLALACLLLFSGCAKRAQEEPLRLSPEKSTTEQAKIGEQLGYAEAPLVLEYRLDSTLESVHYAVYRLENGSWLLQWQSSQMSPGKAGQILLFSDALNDGFSILLQCDNICVKDQLQVASSEVGGTGDALNKSVRLDEAILVDYEQEIPVLLQSAVNVELADGLDVFYHPEQWVNEEEIWVLTIRFSPSAQQSTPIQRIDA